VWVIAGCGKMKRMKGSWFVAIVGAERLVLKRGKEGLCGEGRVCGG